MLKFLNRCAVAVGEAMVELAPIADGTYRRGFAGDTFNTIWHIGQLLGSAAQAGFVTRVGPDSPSEAFLMEAAADGLELTGVSRERWLGKTEQRL